MPAFSHFFLKRFSARSKFSSSWIMTSDKIYFPPSWRIASPACVQTDKVMPRRGIGQAKPPRLALGLQLSATTSPVRRRRSPSLATLCSGGAANYAPSLRSVARLLVAKWVLATRTSSAFPPGSVADIGSRWRLVRARRFACPRSLGADDQTARKPSRRVRSRAKHVAHTLGAPRRRCRARDYRIARPYDAVQGGEGSSQRAPLCDQQTRE